jgi:hypothetical protein
LAVPGMGANRMADRTPVVRASRVNVATMVRARKDPAARAAPVPASVDPVMERPVTAARPAAVKAMAVRITAAPARALDRRAGRDISLAPIARGNTSVRGANDRSTTGRVTPRTHPRERSGCMGCMPSPPRSRTSLVGCAGCC